MATRALEAATGQPAHATHIHGMGLLAGLVDLLYPPACAGCRSLCPPEPAAFCELCELAVEPLPSPRCRRCAEPGAFREETCPRCTALPPPFRRAFAPFVHGGAMSRAIHRLKYEDHPELARPLGGLLARHAASFLAQLPDAWLCPLPLHASRFRVRRYDQSWLLGAELSQRTGRKLLRRGLERRRATERQVGQDEQAREANVAGAFVAHREQIEGRHLILVDDVFTTGATARSAARALCSAGAARVDVLTLARAWSG